MTAPAPVDYPALAELLGLRGACTVHIFLPEEVKAERPADNADGALCVAISQTYGPFSDSPVRPILTATHRATGLCLTSAAGPWPATPAGLRRAKAAVKLLRGAPGFDWSAEDPKPADVAAADAIAALRELVGDLGSPEPAKKPRAPRKPFAGA